MVILESIGDFGQHEHFFGNQLCRSIDHARHDECIHIEWQVVAVIFRRPYGKHNDGLFGNETLQLGPRVVVVSVWQSGAPHWVSFR